MSRSDRLHAAIRVERNGFSLDVDLVVEPGFTMALLGPNGAGKSTVVEAVTGLRRLDDGAITLGTRTLDDPSAGLFVPPEARSIGVVFQDYLLFGHLTVADNVGFGLVSRGADRDTVARRVASWLDRFDLAGVAERKARDLSGGESQRVALARALITEPDVLLLDEPMAALDAGIRVSTRHDLADHLSGFPGPRLLITHDPTEAFLLADEIAIIEAGKVTQVGTADDIRLRPKTRYVADLAGSNLVIGTASAGSVAVDGHIVHVADTALEGEVIATIHPHAISVHLQQPQGSPRNAWQTTITRLEHFGDRVRLQTGAPLPLAVEVTPGAVDALGLGVDVAVWISIKATEIGLQPG
jgi:molybdate transport system ATP-binding protein